MELLAVVTPPSIYKNSSLSSVHFQLELGNYHFLPQPGNTPPFVSSSYCFFLPLYLLHISDLFLYNRPHPDLRLDLLIILRILCNCYNRLDNGVLVGGVEGYHLQ